MKRYKSPYEDFVKGKKPKERKPPRVKTIRERLEITVDAVADADILEELKKHPNKSEYIREALRSYMRGE